MGGTLQNVRAWLATADLPSGTRLPPERELSDELGISRAELRKALAVLETEGRLIRNVGRGTFLANPPTHSVDAPIESQVTALAERTSPHEAMIARLAIEPELAQMAALHATPRQLSRLRQLTSLMRRSKSWTAYEELDAEFHDHIATCAGNELLHSLHKIVNGVRMVVVWRRLNPSESAPPSDYHSFDEHERIVAALERRDRAGAQRSMREHLRSTLSVMTDDS